MFLTGFCAGIIAYFVLMRLVDTISHKAGKAVDYDCTRCAAKCTGFKCYKERLAQEVEDGEISDVPPED